MHTPLLGPFLSAPSEPDEGNGYMYETEWRGRGGGGREGDGGEKLEEGGDWEREIERERVCVCVCICTIKHMQMLNEDIPPPHSNYTLFCDWLHLCSLEYVDGANDIDPCTKDGICLACWNLQSSKMNDGCGLHLQHHFHHNFGVTDIALGAGERDRPEAE